LTSSILLVSEPNKKLVGKGGWYLDEQHDAAVKVIGKKPKVFRDVKKTRRELDKKIKVIQLPRPVDQDGQDFYFVFMTRQETQISY
jgi:hypothetical protein